MLKDEPPDSLFINPDEDFEYSLGDLAIDDIDVKVLADLGKAKGFMRFNQDKMEFKISKGTSKPGVYTIVIILSYESEFGEESTQYII